MIDRKESITIEVDFPYQRIAEKHKKDIKQLTLRELEFGDKLSWSFSIEYHNNICKQINSILNILSDPEAIVTYSVEELNYGKSIFISLIQKLERLQTKIEKRIV